MQHGSSPGIRRAAILLSLVLGAALALSAIWQIPYIYSLMGFAALVFLGHVVTIDDDIPGGWSNPDGTEPFPWSELLVKGVVLLLLCAAAAFFPALRRFGGG